MLKSRDFKFEGKSERFIARLSSGMAVVVRKCMIFERVPSVFSSSSVTGQVCRYS